MCHGLRRLLILLNSGHRGGSSTGVPARVSRVVRETVSLIARDGAGYTDRRIFTRVLPFIGSALLVALFISPVYIFPDSQGYFAYLPSIFYDGDLDFYNEFVDMKIPVPLAQTATGYISNNWNFGSAFFWAPFYAAAKLFADPVFSRYSAWFWLWINFGTMVYGLAAALLLWLMLRQTVAHAPKGLLIIVAFIGTPMFFYTFIIPSTAHGISAFAVTVFIWYWLHSFSHDDRLSRYVLLGLLLGTAAMVRTQEALFGIVVLMDLVFRSLNGGKPVFAVKAAAVFGVAFTAGILPQLLFWQIVNGSAFAVPSAFNISAHNFAPLRTLFSSYHGILYWTPLYFVALAGLVIGIRRKPELYAGLLCAVLCQWIVNSLCVAFWEGYSFGLRQMTSSLPVAVLGLAEFWRWFSKKKLWIRAAGWTALSIPTLWTFGLMANYYRGLDLLGYLSPREILGAQVSLITHPAEALRLFSGCSGQECRVYGALALVGLLALALFYWVVRIMQKKKALPAAVLFCGMVVMASMIIMRAHLTRPAVPETHKKPIVTTDESARFFIAQTLEIKHKYGL